MIRYECDKCKAKLGANDPQRFILKMEVYAAAGHIEFTDEQLSDSGQNMSEVLQDLAQADPDEVENRTYRCLRFDLCDHCRRNLLEKPLG